MIADIDMHDALVAFLQANKTKIPYSPLGVSYCDEGVFTSIKRMRTVFPLDPPLAGASQLELRGVWHFPMMMMNDYMPRDPEAPTIMVMGAGKVLKRFSPTSIEDVHRILEHDVFDVANLPALLEAQRQQIEVERLADAKKRYLAAKRLELNTDLKLVVTSVAEQCDPEIKALAQALLVRLGASRVKVYTDVDQYTSEPVLGAYQDGLPYGVQAVAKEVEKRVYLAVMAAVSDAV